MKNYIAPIIFKFFLKTTMISALVFAVVPAARADFSSGNEFPSLEDQIRKIPTTCHDQESCKLQGLELRVLFSPRYSTDEIRPLLPRLQLIAEDQASMWADTILEGFYDADGKTNLDKVEGIFRGSKLIAYRISYSEKAWVVGANGQVGQEGRITEGSFVSKTLRSWFRDDESLAEFH